MEASSSPARLTRRRLLAVGVTGGATLAGCTGFTGPDVTEASSQTLAVPDGVVSVENRNGDVEVEPHEGGDVEAGPGSARRRRPAAYPDVRERGRPPLRTPGIGRGARRRGA